MQQQSVRPGNDLPTAAKPASMRSKLIFAATLIGIILIGAAL